MRHRKQIAQWQKTIFVINDDIKDKWINSPIKRQDLAEHTKKKWFYYKRFTLDSKTQIG